MGFMVVNSEYVKNENYLWLTKLYKGKFATRMYKLRRIAARQWTERYRDREVERLGFSG